MVVNSDGESLSAIPDICKNYKPINTKPTTVISAFSGILYLCRNLNVLKNEPRGCLWCHNRKHSIKSIINDLKLLPQIQRYALKELKIKMEN